MVYNVYTISGGNKIKRMCSNEHAFELHVWLTKYSYKNDVITKENEKNTFYWKKGSTRKTSQKKKKYERTDNTNSVVIYHTVLNYVIEIRRKAHKHTLNSIRLSDVLPPSTLKDCLVRSKLKVCVHYIFASLFGLNKSTYETRKNALNLQIFKYHDVIKCSSMRHWDTGLVSSRLILPHGEKVPLKLWLATHLMMVSQ